MTVPSSVGPAGTAAAPDAESTRPPGSPAAKLEIRGLRKTFGAFVALERTNLDVHEGEFVTLLGPSGSGKTTLLLATAGLNEPDEGEIWIDGRPATYLPPYKRGIGMVFQNYALFPHMTVFDNIAFPLRMRRASAGRIREAVTRILEVIRLPDIAHRHVRQLSGGQQQRVALARALVYEPSIVLMDEPLGALDKKLREQLQFEIRRLHASLGLAMLYVTHDQEEALVMSDRICLMRDGRIVQLGTPQELYFRPTSLFAADFLGESNLLRGELVAADGEQGKVALACGGHAMARMTAPIEVGSDVRVMIRPECVRIATAPAGEHSLPARMTELVLSGGTTKCFLRVDGRGGQEMMAQVLTGHFMRQGTPEGRVYLEWDSDFAVVLKDE